MNMPGPNPPTMGAPAPLPIQPAPSPAQAPGAPYTFTPPVPATDPARVAAYFQGKGYALTDGASLNSDGTVSIVLDRDPTADVPGYADAPTPQEQTAVNAVAAVRAYVASVRATPVAARTPEQKVILAMAALIRDLAQVGQSGQGQAGP